MKPLFTPFKRLALQFLLLLALYMLSRCLFTWINLNHFEGLNGWSFLKICFFALRYDISGLLALNAAYALLLLAPVPNWKWKGYERFTQLFFLVTNILALLFEISDWAYFPFNFKRATADVLNMVSRKGDFWSLLPGFVTDFWYVPLAVAVFSMLLIWFNRKICRATPFLSAPDFRNSWTFPFWQTVSLIVFGGVCLVGIRGGFQYVPIGIRNAVQVTNSEYAPIVINTPFSIINTFTNDKLPDVHYLPDNELQHYVDPVKQYASDHPFTRKNVVLIILESFSKEFTKLGGAVSYTPFLDSLMDISLTCTHAYANGLHSAEGVPAIISGVPSLMEESITTSVYGANRLMALPAVLRDKGYVTSFFHGGTNGTMSFDVFCAAAGFDHYYGRTEYGREQDYDGNWGIWDEPFLQYFGQHLNHMETPFMAAVFTLSSHPPFSLPEQYAHRFPKGTLPIHACIGYSDYALSRFFASVRHMPWFDNTLFVITPDHCSPLSADKDHQRNVGKYEIPILFYAPGDTSLHGYTDTLTQQIDILPSVLDYLGYSQPFFAYGNSIFRKSRHPRYTINQESGRYQWLMNNYLLQTLEVQPQALYKLTTDSSYTKNLLPDQEQMAQEQLLPYLKAFIQSYRQALNQNKMWVPATAGH